MASNWADLVEAARWAPSPHNLQSWLVRPRTATDAELLYDPRRTLPGTDPGGRFIAVGLGIFVESLAVAAAARGFQLDVGYDGSIVDAAALGPTTFARLSLLPGPAADELDVELLRQRRTSRLAYDGTPVGDEELASLRTLARSHGHALGWSHDARLVAAMLALNEDTLFFDLTDAVARREIGRWLRFSAAEAARCGDGFSPAALGFPGPLLRLFFRAHPLLALPVVRGGVRRLYRRTMRGTRTIAWLQGPFEQPHDWLEAGRMLQRLWLTLTARGIRLHPFGSVVTNPGANARVHELLDLDPAMGTFWLALRLGYSDEPPRSHRLDTEEIIVA